MRVGWELGIWHFHEIRAAKSVKRTTFDHRFYLFYEFDWVSSVKYYLSKKNVFQDFHAQQEFHTVESVKIIFLLRLQNFTKNFDDQKIFFIDCLCRKFIWNWVPVRNSPKIVSVKDSLKIVFVSKIYPKFFFYRKFIQKLIRAENHS